MPDHPPAPPRRADLPDPTLRVGPGFDSLWPWPVLIGLLPGILGFIAVAALAGWL